MSLPQLPGLDSGSPDVDDEARDLVRAAGVPSAHVNLVAGVLVEDARSVAIESSRDTVDLDAQIAHIERAARRVGFFASRADGDDAIMVSALLTLSLPRQVIGDDDRNREPVPPTSEPTGSRLRRLCALWLAATPSIDIAAGLLRLPRDHREISVERFVLRATASAGRLDLGRFLDVPAVVDRLGAGNPDNPAQVWFWLSRLGRRAFGDLLEVVKGADDAQAGPLALGMADVLAHLIESPPTSELDAIAEPREQDVRAWILHIEERLERRPDDLQLEACLWTLLRLGLTGSLDEDIERRILAMTWRRMSRLRRDVAEGEGAALRASGPDRLHYLGAFRAMQAVAEDAKAMKAALLLLRALPEPAVGADLRHWPEGADAPESAGGPPTRWRWVAELTVGLAHTWARDDREDDPQLQEMREALARYFLDRLGSRSKGKDAEPQSDEGMLEPSPAWRRAYIQAVRVLRVNPRGRGHRVLHWLQANDPHEEIRNEASVAHGEMLAKTPLPKGSSPLRAVMHALWWVRWGHRCGLGLHVDHDAADRTRQTEIRRTKEVESIK